MDGPIASAVILPEELAAPAPASPPLSLKRRQSSFSEDHAKRARPNEEEGEINHRRGSNSGPKPAAPVRREKGRERRLFGAALGALSQNPTSAAQKRRSEIEQRQLARRKLEDEESEQRKAERIARRRTQRLREQEYFEVEVMRTRHQNLLHTAHFLRTRTEPHLYYRPWETSPEEEDIIRNQISEARETIERERQDHEARRRQQHQREWHSTIYRDTDASHANEKHGFDSPQKPSRSNNGIDGNANSPLDLEMKDGHAEGTETDAVNEGYTAQDSHSSTKENHELPAPGQENRDNADENGEDIVEEAAEDTVIY